jgi:predicted porin
MRNSNYPAATPGPGVRRPAAAIAALLAMAASSSAIAGPELEALRQQVQELQQRADALAKQQAAQQAAAPATVAAIPAPAASPVKAPADGGLGTYGVTLYGTLDVNLTYLSYGMPQSDYLSGGTYSLIQKNSNRSIFTLGENGLTQSRIGLQGSKEILGGWSGIFRLETIFNPLSGDIADALKSMTVDNGKAVAAQTTSADSSLAGQLFNSAAYLGFGHRAFGTITFGRQNGLLADGIAKYDPMATAQAFSPHGRSGNYSAGGSTESGRLDNSVKYNAQFGALHAGVQYQFNGASGSAGSDWQLVLGGASTHGSFDVYYVRKEQAIASASLSAAQVTTLNCPFTVAAGAAAPCNVAGGGGTPLDKALAGTVSDNTDFTVMATYDLGSVKVFGGYEHIQFANPDTPLPAGSETIGGYVLAYVNKQAGAGSTFEIKRIWQYEFVGLRYSFSPALEGRVAWYRQEQSAYATGANAGCNSAVATNCSGLMNAYSGVLVYNVSKSLDAYGGAMWSGVRGGLASGFLHTNTIDPTLGVRYTF